MNTGKPAFENLGLVDLRAALGIKGSQSHRALDDARDAAKVYRTLLERMGKIATGGRVEDEGENREHATRNLSFPYGRLPLASPHAIQAFIERWKPVFQKQCTAEIENPDFPELLWSKGFVCKDNELASLILHREYKTAKRKIRMCDDIVSVQSATLV